MLHVIGLTFAMASGLFLMFGYHPGLLWSVVGALLFSFYLMYDIQMIMGGEKKEYSFDEDSYILAAVTLYLDIINMFLYILRILSEVQKK
mmetsp:Transcript_22799/g.35104  ORF Transcript_22799/g.35104 Transcript_22799/m.35104 type:complete len:90 (+) Transcript_22799:492-761(+)